jgi:hypothetical protein
MSVGFLIGSRKVGCAGVFASLAQGLVFFGSFFPAGIWALSCLFISGLSGIRERPAEMLDLNLAA